MPKAIFILSLILLCGTASAEIITVNKGPPINARLWFVQWWIGDTPVLVVKESGLQKGDVLDFNAFCAVSERQDWSQNYPGFFEPAFVAGQVWLSPVDPSSGWFHWTGVPIGPQGGDDTFPGGGTLASPMRPYVPFQSAGKYQITGQTASIGNGGQPDTGDQWIVLVMWASSASSSPRDNILIEPSSCWLTVSRRP